MNNGNIWITKFKYFAIWMPDICLVFKWHLNSGQDCPELRSPSCVQMSVLQEMIWIAANFEQNYLNNGPFNDRTNVHDLNTTWRRYLWLCEAFDEDNRELKKLICRSLQGFLKFGAFLFNFLATLLKRESRVCFLAKAVWSELHKTLCFTNFSLFALNFGEK